MKKTLLIMSALFVGAMAYSQVVVSGISPAAIQGNYDFTAQAACGAWPGETDDGTWGVFPGIDFNIPGTFIQAEIEFVEDGTPGLNPQGNPISQEGCNGPLTNSVANGNDLTGKIAVVYRNTCWFSTKIYYAEQAGALAVIVINREDALVNMLANTDPLNGPLGVDCTIPAVFISSIDGANIVAEMANGPVEMFIGNKIGAFPNDAGSVKGEFLVPPFGGVHKDFFTGFDMGIQVYNYGANNQANVTVNANITGPSGVVYDETLGPFNMLSGDTVFLFPGNGAGLEFTPYAYTGAHPDGDYTLTYTVDLGVVDDAAYDNVYTAEYKVQDQVISLSRLTGSNEPVANSYPSNSTTEYQSCMMFQEPNVDGLAIEGVYFVPHTDTSVNELAGAEIFVNAYQWDDAWVDLNDPGYTFDPATQDGFQNLNLVTFATHYPGSNDEVDDVAYASFGLSPLILQNDVRYLVCLQTFESTTISFGYDNATDYGANYSIFAQPISPVIVDASTYAAGWNGTSAASIGLKVAYVGLNELTQELAGSAYPNPAMDVVTVSVDAEGAANLTVTDVAGKLAINSEITLVGGKASVNVASLEAGMYLFNVTLANGQTSQFNVIKK